MSNKKGLRTPPVFTMADIRNRYFPNCRRANGRYDNRAVLRAFKEGRIQGTPTRFRTYPDPVTGRKNRFVTDFIVSKPEWDRLWREGINYPVDSETEVSA